MSKDKVTIIFGGNVGIYLYSFKIFQEIEKSFKCKIKRVGHFKFQTKIDKKLIEFFFCYGPTRDKNYKIRKESFAFNEKEIVPEPSDELVKKIKKEGTILFFGLCGGFGGKKGEVYLPQEFSEILFEKEFIREREILHVKPLNKILGKNFLIGKLKGKKGKIITSNLTLQPRSMENDDEELLINLANSLSKKVDIVDKESYVIAKHFKNFDKIGLMFIASDILTKKRHMMKGDFKPNINRFNRNCVKSLKVALNPKK